MYQTKNLGLNITEIDKDSLQAFNFDTDLGDNFKAIDEKTLSHRNITNCLLEVPQDIKVECVDGTITVKAGSKIWIPYGTTQAYNIGDLDQYGNIVDDISFQNNKFFYAIRLDSDKTNNQTNDAAITRICWFNVTDGVPNALHEHSSGTEGYTGANNQYYYFTDTNYAKRYLDGLVSEKLMSLPIGLVTGDGINMYGSVVQVFNGYGYIGSTLFELPGVKGLITEGINDDGTLKTVIKTTTKVAIDPDVGPHSNSIISSLEGDIEATVWLGEYDKHPSTEGVLASPRYLNTRTNFIQLDAGITGDWKNQYGYLQVFEDLKLDPTGKILSITPKKPFRAVDHNNYIQKITELETKIATLQAAVEALQGS